MKAWVRLRAALCALLAAALLSGCAVSGTLNPDELLRAPQLSGEYSAVQKALNEYLGESAQLKYPTNGNFLSPFLFGDWDGDGAQDAAVLYLASSSADVQLAVLKTDAAGKWQVCGTAVGLSDTVDTVSFAAMQSPAAAQILVGYTTAGDKYLAVYSFQDGTLQTVLGQTYSQYLVEDITGNGTEDLVLLSAGETGQTQVQLLTDDGDQGFTLLQTIGLSSGQFSGCASLAAGVGANGGHYLVLDGWTGASGGYLASSVLQYDATSGGMDAAELPGTQNLYEDTLRYAACLTSRDLDGDGVVEIPTQAEEAGILNMTQGKRWSFVRWMDYTSAEPEKSFGILDEDYGYYLELPTQWEGNLLMVDGADDSVDLYNLSGDQLLLSLRVNSGTGAGGVWQRIGTVASKQIRVRLGTDVTEVTAFSLSQAIHLL